jgi:hypothetical protein
MMSYVPRDAAEAWSRSEGGVLGGLGTPRSE